MSSSDNPDTNGQSGEADFAKVKMRNSPRMRPETDTDSQAFKELTRGEQTAAALEKQLSSIEKKIEELLAQAARDEEKLAKQATTNGSKKQ